MPDNPHYACGGGWLTTAEPHIQHRCELDDEHTGPHRCPCGDTLDYTVPGRRPYAGRSVDLVTSRTGTLVHRASYARGKTWCGMFFQQVPAPEGAAVTCKRCAS
jgi:hypothetical protein